MELNATAWLTWHDLKLCLSDSRFFIADYIVGYEVFIVDFNTHDPRSFRPIVKLFH